MTVRACMSPEEVVAAVDAQANEVRRLKDQGLGNKSPEVSAAVTELLRLKALLPPLTLRKTNRGNLITMLRLIPGTTLQGIREGLTLPLQGLRSRPDISEDPWPQWAQRDPMLRFGWLVMVSFTPKTLVLGTSTDTVRTHLEKVS